MEEVLETGLLIDKDQTFKITNFNEKKVVVPIMRYDPHVKQLNCDYMIKNNPKMDNGIYHGVSLADMDTEEKKEFKQKKKKRI